LQEHPLSEVQEWGMILFSGVIRSMIKPFPRLWDALMRDGEPPQVLLERLPTTVYDAWRNDSWGELVTFRHHVVNMLIEDGALADLRTHLSPKSLRKARQEIAQWGNISSALEEWRARQEVSQRLDELAAHAGLAGRAAEVFALQRQGLRQKQISTHLGISRDDVNTYEKRIRAKIRATKPA
jgi:DNA-binding CsgD family transcriptional regulator